MIGPCVASSVASDEPRRSPLAVGASSPAIHRGNANVMLVRVVLGLLLTPADALIIHLGAPRFLQRHAPTVLQTTLDPLREAGDQVPHAKDDGDLLQLFREQVSQHEQQHAIAAASPTLGRRCITETLATGLAFFIANAVVGLAGMGATASAIVWGVVIACAVRATVAVSGAHFNPAVTLAFAAGGTFPWSETVPYIIAQYVGAAAAAACLSAPWLLGGSLGALPIVPTLGTEARVTSLLLLGVYVVSDAIDTGRVPSKALPGLIGVLITSLNLGFSHLGTCLNPAMGAASRLVHAFGGRGAAAALAGATSFTFAPVAGALMGGYTFALLCGKGEGVYAGVAKLGRRRAQAAPA